MVNFIQKNAIFDLIKNFMMPKNTPKKLVFNGLQKNN